MGPALVMYLRTMGDRGAIVWVVLAGSVGDYGGRVVWGGEEGLRRAWDEELCPPLVLSMVPKLMREGFRRG